MNRLKTMVKNSMLLYSLYYYVMSLGINVLKLFTKTDDKLILFVSYGGRHYSDSPRVLYEAMLEDERFKGYKMVWAFEKPENFDIEKTIKIDSFAYFLTALKSRCWITNVMIERALNFKGKRTFYFFTTHGVLVKLCGNDLKKGSSFNTFAKLQYDYSIAQSEYEKKIEEKQYGLRPNQIGILGMPKNDILVSHNKNYREEIRKKLGIPKGKKAILYAPTFREATGSMEESFDINISKWRKILGDKYILLYRAHPVVRSSEKEEDIFFNDVSDYEMVEDLMIASDLLISDYSGIIFDYCLMHKPIILFTYDYDQYSSTRGLYFDIRKELPYAMDEDELIGMIRAGKEENLLNRTIMFQKKFATEYGQATKKCMDLIWEKIRD